MKEIPNDLSDNARYYIEVWMRALNCFLGWDQNRVLQWAEQYYDEFRTNEDWFCHDGDAIHYLVPLLIPPELQCKLSAEELEDLKTRLSISIHVGGADLPPRIVALNETFPMTPEALEEIDRFRKKAEAKGWYFSGNMDTYNWSAAKTRIEHILRDYKSRDQVPRLARDLDSSDPSIREAAAEALARMGKLAKPATTELVKLVYCHLHEKAALLAMESLKNIGIRSLEVLKVLEHAATNSDADVQRKARYVHYALTLDRRSWDQA